VVCVCVTCPTIVRALPEYFVTPVAGARRGIVKIQKICRDGCRRADWISEIQNRKFVAAVVGAPTGFQKFRRIRDLPGNSGRTATAPRRRSCPSYIITRRPVQLQEVVEL